MNGDVEMVGGEGPLAGLRVLDLTIAMAGPLATSRLGDMGADVIKIESPTGDFSRQWPLNGYRHGGDSSAFMMLNRNKRAMVMDLKQASARGVFRKLVEDADIIVQNFRPGVAERLGIDYATLSAINPHLVFVSITGYGDTGPMIDRPGQDLLVQSFSGLTFNAGMKGGLPHPSPVYMIDTCASHLAAQAALAGYIQRERTGRGGHFKVSLLAAAMEIQIQEISTFLTSGRTADRSEHPFGSNWMDAPYGIYATADGFIAIAQARLPVLAELFGDETLAALACEEVGFEDAEARLLYRDRIGRAVAENFRCKSTEAWIAELTPHDIWVGPVLDYATLAEHPQAQDLFVTVEHPAGPYRTLAPAITNGMPRPVRRGPGFGEHTAEVLAELGIAGAELEALKASGAVQ